MSVDFSTALKTLRRAILDTKGTNKEEEALPSRVMREEFARRNKKLTDLLDNYITQRKSRFGVNAFLKQFIFWFFIGILSLLTFAVVWIRYNIDYNKAKIYTVASLLSVAVTYVGSIFIVFEIMSKYLFPSDEEKDTIEMIKTVVENDLKTEELLYENENCNYAEMLCQYKKLEKDGTITSYEFEELKEKILERAKQI